MKALLTGMLLIGAMTVGCQKESETSTPTEKETKKDTTQPNGEVTEKTFKLQVPTGDTNIDQGQTEKVEISLDKGDNFDKEVTLKFDAPTGITVEPKEPKIAAGNDSVEVMVTVSPDAPEGVHSVKVSGSAQGMDTVDQAFKVKVTKAE